MLARVRDHVEHKYVRGFRMLILGWSDGNTFLPVAFSLLSSNKELLKKPGKAKVLANAIVQIGNDSEDNPVPARILIYPGPEQVEEMVGLAFN